MPPIGFLGILLAFTAAAWLADKAVRQHRARLFRRLAAEWQSNAEADLFNLAARVAQGFSVPEATDLHVMDLIYGEGDQHDYLFTVEFTRGPIDGYHRASRAASFCEAVESRSADCPPGWSSPPKNCR